MRTLMVLSLVAALAACRSPPQASPPQPAPGTTQSDLADTMRQPNTAAANGQFADSNRLFISVIDAPNASRDAIANAAVGLYRTSAYTNAARGFAKLGAFARGEEDLRYYNA